MARTHVELTMKPIRSESPGLRAQEAKGAKGALAIAGAMYDLATAAVMFLPPH